MRMDDDKECDCSKCCFSWWFIFLLCLIAFPCFKAMTSHFNSVEFDHNPHKELSGFKTSSPAFPGFDFTYFSPAPGYNHTTCDIVTNHPNDNLVMEDIVIGCSRYSGAVLNAHSDLECKDIEPKGQPKHGRCFSRDVCQGDACKFDCNYTRNNYILINMTVHPWSSLTQKHAGDAVGVEWQNRPVVGYQYMMKWNIDDGSNLPDFALRSFICDFKLENGIMTELYVNRAGSYAGLTEVFRFFMGMLVAVLLVMTACWFSCFIRVE